MNHAMFQNFIFSIEDDKSVVLIHLKYQTVLAFLQNVLYQV